MKEYIVNNFKATNYQYAMGQLSTCIDLEGCSLKTMMFEKYPSISPYTYCGNNPVMFVDMNGREIIFSGEKEHRKAAFKEFKAGAKAHGISARMNKNGVVSGKYKGKGEISQEGQLIMNAINDKSVTVNIIATDGNTTSNVGYMTAGAAFMGSTVSATPKKVGKDDVTGYTYTATARQEINPYVLADMSSFHGKSGQDMLHEATEGYLGGLIAKNLGLSISPALATEENVMQPTLSNSVYDYAHNNAISPSGKFREIIRQRFIQGRFESYKIQYEAYDGNRSKVISERPY